MLARVDPKHRVISLLSIPRDLLVEIPGYGQDKVNAAYSEGGPKLALATVKALTGLRINYLATVDFRGFTDLVNALGGVYINVDQNYQHSNANLTYGTYAEIHVPPGYELLNGTDALAFSRYRHTDSDFYRNARQQLFLRAFESRASSRFGGISLTDLPAIKRLLDTIARNVQITGSDGPPGVHTLVNYATLAYSIKGHIVSVKLDAQVAGDPTDSFVEATPQEVQAAVHAFTHPQTIGQPRAQLPRVRERPKRPRHHGFRPSVDPTTVTLAVLNGNGKTGSANVAADALGHFGYRIEAVGDAPSFSYPKSWVYYRPGFAAAAADLARILGDARTGALPQNFTQGTDVAVVVGAPFDGTTAVKPPSAAKPAAPKRSSTFPDATAYLVPFRNAAHRIHIRGLYPTVVQSGSELVPFSPAETVRTYTIAGAGKGPNSMYAVFHLTNIAGAYWGIEETRFTDAPILAHPDALRRLDGRTYRFYFNGQHIHLIAIVQHGTAYWISNTLLDDLSNDDMIAIARSLRPLR
jgi:LCP family protein required for cell wall assembly